MKRLPDTELEVMKGLWGMEGPATRGELEGSLCHLRWATNTFNTYLARLTEKGVVVCEKRGKVNYYTPLLSQAEYLEFESRSVLNRVFGRSLKTFVASLAGAGALEEGELDELRDYLEALKEEGRR